METIKSAEELVAIASTQNCLSEGKNWLTELGLSVESQSKQFPYKFSIFFLNDRWDFAVSEDEIKVISKRDNSPGEVEHMFQTKITPIVMSKVG
jgi:hypothetical protein